jgi:LemA protein
MAVWVVIGALLALALLAAAVIRSLDTLRQRVERAWAHLDGQLRRRCDLVPGLIEAAAAHGPDHAGALQELAAARQAALDARGIPDRYEAENRLTEALRHLFTVAPALSEAILGALEQELTAAEEGIAAARRDYDNRVMALNTRRHRLPWRLFAGRFPPGEYFIMDEPAHR